MSDLLVVAGIGVGVVAIAACCCHSIKEWFIRANYEPYAKWPAFVLLESGILCGFAKMADSEVNEHAVKAAAARYRRWTLNEVPPLLQKLPSGASRSISGQSPTLRAVCAALARAQSLILTDLPASCEGGSNR